MNGIVPNAVRFKRDCAMTLKEFLGAADMSSSREFMAAMKVTTQDLSGLGAAGASGAQDVQKPGGGGKGAGWSSGAGSDRVDFSSALGSLSRAMSSEGSTRQAKIESLTAQYQAGSYSADSAAIGRGLISEAFGE
jgi:anti-sigma28 factor (negative regulator of flagellin synthesis)